MSACISDTQSSVENSVSMTSSNTMVISVSRSTERRLIKYSEKEKKTHLFQYKELELWRELQEHEKDSKIIYPNQEEAAKKIILLFERNTKLIHMMVIARTQSGKTGTSIATMFEFVNHKQLRVPRDNIVWITGHSSKEWIEQTLERLPSQVRTQVYHRNNLGTDFINYISGKKNVLILLDEIQIAAQERQTIHTVFEKLGYTNKDYLLENNIKFIEFTATPNGHAADLLDLKEYSERIIMKPGEGYIGYEALKRAGKIKQCKNLHGFLKVTEGHNNDDFEYDENAIHNLNEIKNVLDTFNKLKYVIIRSPKIKNHRRLFLKHLEDVFDLEKGKNLFEYDGESEIEKINKELLEKEPNEHTFIIIKDLLRCAKTICKKHLGIVYERHCRTYDDSVIVQGLFGRITGYYPEGCVLPIVWTNIESLAHYEVQMESKFKNPNLKWNSNTTKRVGRKTVSKGTFNSPRLLNGFEAKEKDERPRWDFREFDTLKKAKKYFQLNLKTRFQKMFEEDKDKPYFTGKGDSYNGGGPRKPTQNESKFNLVAIGDKKGLRVVHRNEVIEKINGEDKLKIKYNLTRNSGRSYYKLYSCYRDINNKETATFVLAYI
jgi:hypothetical protein